MAIGEELIVIQKSLKCSPEDLNAMQNVLSIINLRLLSFVLVIGLFLRRLVQHLATRWTGVVVHEPGFGALEAENVVAACLNRLGEVGIANWTFFFLRCGRGSGACW